MLSTWKAERATAIVALGRSNPGELVVVLLDEGRVDEAWAPYEANASARIPEKDLLALIQARSVEAGSGSVLILLDPGGVTD